MEHGFREVFNWSFLASFSIASTAVVAIANTLRQWWKLQPRWSALIAAEVLAFYAAATNDQSFTIGKFFMTLAFGALLCCYAVGIQGTVVGLKQRYAQGVRAGGPDGWWSAWF